MCYNTENRKKPKGDQKMDLAVFDETEIRTMFNDMLQNMNESQKQIFVDHY